MATKTSQWEEDSSMAHVFVFVAHNSSISTYVDMQNIGQFLNATSIHTEQAAVNLHKCVH